MSIIEEDRGRIKALEQNSAELMEYMHSEPKFNPTVQSQFFSTKGSGFLAKPRVASEKKVVEKIALQTKKAEPSVYTASKKEPPTAAT